MKKCILGKTDIAVSRLGLGTVKFGRNQQVKYPAPFDLPSDQAILELLGEAADLGINLLDTAPAYGTSEERLGKLLKNKRHDWVIATKAGEDFIDGQSRFDFSPSAIKSSVLRSLKRLQTDYVDIVLVHSNGEDQSIIEEHNVFEVLAELKKAGWLRAFGMSTKTVDGGTLAVEQSDVAMVTYNPIETNERSVIQHAHRLNKGIFIKKGFASGHLQKISDKNPVETALNFIFAEPGVHSMVLGTLNKAHLKEAALAVP